MVPIAKIQNSNTFWSSKLRPRVGTTVIDGGIYFSNLVGYNGVTSDTNIWFPLGNQSGTVTVPITRTAGDIIGSDPFYSLNLSSFTSIPALPSKLLVYVDINGDGNFQTLDPVSYNANTKVITGMNSPTDFPSQIIKIFIS